MLVRVIIWPEREEESWFGDVVLTRAVEPFVTFASGASVSLAAGVGIFCSASIVAD
jgi:hypothetical protein